MKKLLAILLTVCLVLSLAGCDISSQKSEEELIGGWPSYKPPTDKEIAAARAARKTIEAYNGPRGTDIPMEYTAEAENEALEGMSPEEAHRLLGLWFRPEEKFALPERSRFFYLCYGVSNPNDHSINLGIPCYIIRFCATDGNSVTYLASYDLTADGELYVETYERGFPEHQLVLAPINFPFEADERILGDSPEGELNVFAAQELLNLRLMLYEPNLMMEHGQWSYDRGNGLHYIYQGIEKQYGVEYYRIDLCNGAETVGEPEVLRSYRMSGKGRILRSADKTMKKWVPLGEDL